MRRSALLLSAVLATSLAQTPPAISKPLAIERNLVIEGSDRKLTLDEPMSFIKIPSVSVALIDRGRVRWAKAFGRGATPNTLYQAASLSKFVAAFGAMKLVEQGRLALDKDVNDTLTSWRVPANEFDKEHTITLRELLSMTGGINVPGYPGYARGAPLPTSLRILEGAPPANSPPVTVIAVPGSSYHYSGGGYQIIEAMVSHATHKSFAKAMQEIVLGPVKMSRSEWTPLPTRFESDAARAHLADGSEVEGGWHVYPELAAAGLWSTPTDLCQIAD